MTEPVILFSNLTKPQTELLVTSHERFGCGHSTGFNQSQSGPVTNQLRLVGDWSFTSINIIKYNLIK